METYPASLEEICSFAAPVAAALEIFVAPVAAAVEDLDYSVALVVDVPEVSGYSAEHLDCSAVPVAAVPEVSGYSASPVAAVVGAGQFTADSASAVLVVSVPVLQNWLAAA